MKQEEIDKIMKTAERNLLNCFLKEIQSNNLTELLTNCFPEFRVNIKGGRYELRVDLTYKYEPHESELYEEDSSTSKNIVISNSYEGKTLFKAFCKLENVHDIEIELDLDYSEIQEIINKKKLIINTDWRTSFRS